MRLGSTALEVDVAVPIVPNFPPGISSVSKQFTHCVHFACVFVSLCVFVHACLSFVVCTCDVCVCLNLHRGTTDAEIKVPMFKMQS